MNRFKCKDKHKCEYTYKKAEKIVLKEMKKAEKIVLKEMKAWNYPVPADVSSAGYCV